VLLGLILIAWRGNVQLVWPRDPSRIFIVTTAAGILLLLLLLIVIGGLNYSTRHGFPFFGIWLLGLVAVLSYSTDGVREFSNVILVCLGVLVVGSLVYSQIALNSVLREPSPAAARALGDIWERQFACGPASSLATIAPRAG
jgi:hypothetical protein